MFFKKRNTNDPEVKDFLAQPDKASQADEVSAAPINDVSINTEIEAKIALYEEVLRGTEYPKERELIIKYIKSMKEKSQG